MSTIISLVEAAFKTKKESGPNSPEFKVAQKMVFDEVDRILSFGESQVIPIENSETLPADSSIRVHKNHPEKGVKVAASDYCGFVITKNTKPSNLITIDNSK